jgi:hypothetical protein
MLQYIYLSLIGRMDLKMEIIIGAIVVAALLLGASEGADHDRL